VLQSCDKHVHILLQLSISINAQLAFNPAVELSYLSQAEQMAVASAMDKYEIKPSLSQAVRLIKLKQAERLTSDIIDSVL